MKANFFQNLKNITNNHNLIMLLFGRYQSTKIAMLRITNLPILEHLKNFS